MTENRIVGGLASYALTIFAGISAATFYFGDTAARGQVTQAAIAIATMAAGFYFGSSSGSAAKDATIAQASQALAQSTPVLPSTTLAAIKEIVQ